MNTLILSLFLFFINYNDVTNQQQINYNFSADLTGKNGEESIYYSGRLLNPSSRYYKDIQLQVLSSQDQTWQIPLHSGYRPTLYVIDINNDNIADIFFQVKTDYFHETYKQFIISLKDGKVTFLPLPESEVGTGYILHKDHFYILSSTGTLRIKHSMNNKFLFAEENTKEWVHIHPIQYIEPIWINSDYGYGLMSSQEVQLQQSRIKLGDLKTIWYFKNNRWKISHSTLIERLYS